MRKHAVVLAILSAAVGCGCDSKPTESTATIMERIRTESRLLDLPTNPGEVVIADEPAPVSIDAPCIVPIIQGFGAYSDVGWVTPRFFPVPSREQPNGYSFEEMGSGHSRFRVRFRAPTSEDEAIALYGENKPRGGEGILFCDLRATLRSLQGSEIKRLAAWPIASLQAQITLGGVPREIQLEIGPDWNYGEEIAGSIDLSEIEVRELRRNLSSRLGHPIWFKVSTRMRRTGCTQQVDLSGFPAIDLLGLGDGERGALTLETIKIVVLSLSSRKTDVSIVGECGQQMIGLPPRTEDRTADLDCRRAGDSLQCRFEGQFMETALVFGTDTNIGERVEAAY